VTSIDLASATLAHLKMLRRAEGLVLEEPADVATMITALESETSLIIHRDQDQDHSHSAHTLHKKPTAAIGGIPGGGGGKASIPVRQTSLLRDLFDFAVHLRTRGVPAVALPPGSGKGLTGLQVQYHYYYHYCRVFLFLYISFAPHALGI
jgi:hypothetical protein